MSDPTKETPDEVEVLVRSILEKTFDGSGLEDSVSVIVRAVDKMAEETVRARLERARIVENKEYRAAVCENLEKLLAELNKEAKVK